MFVILVLIGNKTNQRKQIQMLSVIDTSHLQFDKSKINIETELFEFISKLDKLQLCASTP